MRRVIIKLPKVLLFDAIIDAFGKIYIKECLDSTYLKIIEYVINGKYKLEFEDGVFLINEGSVFKNLEKFRENPLYKDLIIKKVDYKDILEYTNQHTPPINLIEICNFFNIEYKKIHLTYDGISGYKENHYFIYYKSGITSPYRERFTIAHELGHIFLHFSQKQTLFTDETLNKKLKKNYQKIAARGLPQRSNPKLEAEANSFAANLLMPKNLMFDYTQNAISITKLSKIFQVSKEAVTIRLKNLGILPNY